MLIGTTIRKVEHVTRFSDRVIQIRLPGLNLVWAAATSSLSHLDIPPGHREACVPKLSPLREQITTCAKVYRRDTRTTRPGWTGRKRRVHPEDLRAFVKRYAISKTDGDSYRRIDGLCVVKGPILMRSNGPIHPHLRRAFRVVHK